MFMADLRLYGKTEKRLNVLMNNVGIWKYEMMQFTNDMKMKFYSE